MMPRLFPLVPHHIDSSPITKKVDIKKFRSGREQRIALPDAELRSFEMEWSGLTDDEMKILTDFFIEMDAQFTAFVFRHPDTREDIYVRFSDDTIEPKTVKTNNRPISIKIQEVPETYTDEITGKIEVDHGGVFTVHTTGFVVALDGGTAVLSYKGSVVATAGTYQPIIVNNGTDVLVRNSSGTIVATLSGPIRNIYDTAGNMIFTLADDEQAVIFNNSSYLTINGSQHDTGINVYGG